ncbi:M56 family metallopeptidase [Clostridium massiliamazoniense]|uniref:M56 family metallopeptidase n=1 Tax=Clostridium massiliamazoniense TaxID=1347366 RepID=UPI0006D7F666|nr:M56 family metallopeptidase [Clostridium massiliamazoniense]
MGGFEKLFDFIIKGSIDATILGLVILVIRFFLKEKVSPKVIYSLWIIVLLKFLMPYGPKSSLSIYSMVNKSVESYFTQSSSKDESINEISSDERVNNSSFLENNINFNKENIESKVIKSNEVINGNQEILKDIGSFSWLVIVILLGNYGFFSYIKLKNLGKETNNIMGYLILK